jgi:hypothetical protein
VSFPLVGNPSINKERFWIHPPEADKGQNDRIRNYGRQQGVNIYRKLKGNICDILDMRGYTMNLLFQKKKPQNALNQENQLTMRCTPWRTFLLKKESLYNIFIISSLVLHKFFVS